MSGVQFGAGLVDRVHKILGANPAVGHTAFGLSVDLPGVSETAIVDALRVLSAQGVVVKDALGWRLR